MEAKNGPGRPKGPKYSKKDMKAAALEVIPKYRMMFLEDIYTQVPFCRATFCKAKLHEDEDILQALEKNRVMTRMGLRKKWYDTFNPTTQIALYRLICSPEERDALSLTKHEVTGANGQPLIGDVNINGLSEEEKALLLKIARNVENQ